MKNPQIVVLNEQEVMDAEEYFRVLDEMLAMVDAYILPQANRSEGRLLRELLAIREMVRLAKTRVFRLWQQLNDLNKDGGGN